MDQQLKIPESEKPRFVQRENLVELGEKAAKQMAANLETEHQRWNLPLLTWENGEVVERMVPSKQ